MNVIPQRFLSGITEDFEAEHDGDIETMPMGKDGLWVRCVVTHPPSAEGKRVSLYLSPRDVTDLLKELRTSAIEARR